MAIRTVTENCGYEEEGVELKTGELVRVEPQSQAGFRTPQTTCEKTTIKGYKQKPLAAPRACMKKPILKDVGAATVTANE
ncbi:hypothetical protein SDJN02_01155, partial [Cucurbita argyrosperma subsp. argyrosperma]